MALSSGGQRVALELGGWVCVAAAGVCTVIYFTELKAIARSALGIALPSPTSTANAPQRPDAATGRTRSNGRRVELVAGRGGHYFTDVEINGRPIATMVDSGASIIALTDDDARTAGIFITERDYTHNVSTANGTARVAMVTLDRVMLGDIEVRNVRAAVTEPGKLEQTLLGMSFLSRVRTRTESGRMTIEE